MNERAFQTSHPWIRFEFDPDRAAPPLWSLLGQAVALCRQVAGSVMPPPAAQKMYRVNLVRGARATVAIEGNTLDEEQVSALLDGSLHLPPSQDYLGREVKNILEACDRVAARIKSGKLGRLTPERIAGTNRQVLAGLEAHLEDGVIPGEVPTHSVGVGGRYRGAPREDCHYLLARLCYWLDGAAHAGRAGDLRGSGSEVPGGPHLAPDLPAFLEESENRLARGILSAVLAHLYIAWIHPFGDGNGRTARLVEFMMLARSGVPLPSAQLMSNHYNITRDKYYRQLDRSSRANSGRGDTLGFVQYALRGFVDGLVEQCEYIDRVALNIAWERYVFGAFRGHRPTPASRRRRELVLALGRRPSPVPKRQVRGVTPEIAHAYGDKTSKTLSRDLNWLTKAKLVERTPEGYRAPKELMKAFQIPAFAPGPGRQTPPCTPPRTGSHDSS